MNEQSRAAARAVDEARLWRRMMDMARFGATPAGGVNRAAFSPEDIQARKLLIEWASEFGFATASGSATCSHAGRAATTACRR
ncbi:MAG: hypothetical protein QF767_13895 [Alphaproteobacteria bacterium]|nr:hypothetical protein [Alphaproteobacteria bacterium]